MYSRVPVSNTIALQENLWKYIYIIFFCFNSHPWRGGVVCEPRRMNSRKWSVSNHGHRGTHGAVVLPALITPPDLLNQGDCPPDPQEVSSGQTHGKKLSLWCPSYGHTWFSLSFSLSLSLAVSLSLSLSRCLSLAVSLFLSLSLPLSLPLSSPVLDSPYGLLDEDDLVSDDLVPLDLQLHVVVILTGEHQLVTS